MIPSPSVIRHVKQRLVILRSDYLKIVQGNFAAAKLLSIFENWTNWFVRQGKFERWVKLPMQRLSSHLLGEHNLKQIRAAVGILVKLGFIRQEKRRAHKYDQSWFYWFDIEKVQLAIDSIDPFGEPETEEDFIFLDATLEPQTRVVVESAKSTTSNELILPARIEPNDSIETDPDAPSLNRDLNKNLNTTSNKKSVCEKLPQLEQLKRNRVDIKDERLHEAVCQYPERINDAVAAWLEWSAVGNVSAPTRSLIKAIKEWWKPEKQQCTEQVNPPTTEQMKRLTKMQQDNEIDSILKQPWGSGWALVVNCGNGITVPWWEV